MLTLQLESLTLVWVHIALNQLWPVYRLHHVLNESVEVSAPEQIFALKCTFLLFPTSSKRRHGEEWEEEQQRTLISE